MALINLRNALMSGRRLPYDAEVEYLESTGTQYIDLGKTIQPSDDFEFTGSIVADMANGCVFGEAHEFSWGNTNPAYSFVTTSSGRVYLRYGDSSLPVIGITTVGLGQTFTAALSGSNFIVNGQTVATVSRINAFQGNVDTMALFRRNYFSRGYNQTYSSIRINRLKFGDACDLIPVRVGTVGYLYDRVSGKLFGNAGTGDFVLGPDVVPVEYIESFIGSEGGQYINTGILATTSTKWEIDLAFTTTTTGQLMGCGYSGNQRFNIGIESNAFRGGFGGGWFTISTRDTERHLWRLESLSATQCEASIDGGAAVSYTSTFSPSSTSILLGKRRTSDSPSGVRYYANKIWTSGDLVQNLRPVRVGTEGAMMDVLTRRIYRNAGSGAFTYGNDLKYPISSE